MAYSELIKNFERIRDYMREFYIYGFKSREEFDQKSARSYDNERRRIESYLGDYMAFRQDAGGKNVFLSIDSRSSAHNPLYQALKARSFTDGDITLHFILFDILKTPEEERTLAEIMELMDREYLSYFPEPMLFDMSTVRKKLNEYADMGLICRKKAGKRLVYHRAADISLIPLADAVAYFSEAGLLGVVGSYILDRLGAREDIFSFKHHYITHALESEVLYDILAAITEKRSVFIKLFSRKAGRYRAWEIVPLKIFVSVQNGRQYVLGYNVPLKSMKSYRLDYITEVSPGATAPRFDALREKLERLSRHMWGVRCKNDLSALEHVEVTFYLGDNEEHIYERLQRECRCGRVERLDRHTCRFRADVFDTGEMIPWLRTYICRITQMDFSNRTLENQFRKDIEQMYALYGIEGGGGQ